MLPRMYSPVVFTQLASISMRAISSRYRVLKTSANASDPDVFGGALAAWLPVGLACPAPRRSR